ncbi:hypothetical protein ACJONP_04215, partial [Mycoplasmopsis synoviae]
MVCGVVTWVWLPSVASSAGGVTTGAVNTLNGLTNLVKGILIKKVLNQPLLVTPLTAKYTELESPLTCCKNSLLFYRKSFKLP